MDEDTGRMEDDVLLANRKPKHSQDIVAAEISNSITSTLILTTFAIVIGSSYHLGHQMGCVNPIDQEVTSWIIESHEYLFETTLSKERADLIWATAVSIVNLTGILGGLISGLLADKMGRKGALLLNNIFWIIGTALMTGAKYVNAYPLLVIGRTIIGIGCGIAGGVGPVYILEISPILYRGTFGSLHQLIFCTSLLISQILGLPYLLGTAERWPLIFGFAAFPIGLQLLLLPFCPESPKYNLVIKRKLKKAEEDLMRLRQNDDVSAELYLMSAEAEAAKKVPQVTIFQLFTHVYLKQTLLALLLMAALQLSGINAIFFYSTAIFKGAGLTGLMPFYATLGVSAANVIQTAISGKLVDHPKLGRRILELCGLGLMFFSTLALVGAMSLSESTSEPLKKIGSYGSMAVIFLFVIGFATGPGPIPWFFVSEIFPSHARGSASALASSFAWVTGFLVGIVFLPVNNIIGHYSFLIFSTMLAIIIFLTYKYMPETKGKTVEEVEAELKGRKRG